MKFSYNWLQTFFTDTLPTPDVIEDKLTFHSCEVEEVVAVGNDTVLDVKVLPDKSAWLLSHRGLAKELAVLFGQPLAADPLQKPTLTSPLLPNIKITLTAAMCDYYGAVLIEEVKVGESPAWLREQLTAIGQRSVNNIVDITNYVMFHLGQPLHAFDADKLANSADVIDIKVRFANAGEKFITLSQEELLLTQDDAVITNGQTGQVLALAGVKGGLASGVTADTTRVLLEGAHFDRVAVRRTANRYKLSTDAAKRYENGLTKKMAPFGLALAAEMMNDLASGQVVGQAWSGDATVLRSPVSVSLAKINSVLGLKLTMAEVERIIERFGYEYEITDTVLTVTPPWERDDLVLPEDLIEEVARIHGLSHIESIPPPVQAVGEINARHYYAEVARRTLWRLGFSEVYTSSFREQDQVHLRNALATDKEYLRSSLENNLLAVREKNLPFIDLLGVPAVKIFELGTVFGAVTETFNLGLAVQTGTNYKEKVDGPLLTEAVTALETAFGITLDPIVTAPGYVEYSFDAIVKSLPVPVAYEPVAVTEDKVYEPFSLYPSVSRDIAMWTVEGTEVETIAAALRAAAGPLLVRLTHLDTFTKDQRTSEAFRLVFQAKEKTLDGSEVETLMTSVYDAVAKAGWEVR